MFPLPQTLPIKLALALGFAVLMSAGTGWVVYRVEHAAYLALQLKDAKALTAAVAAAAAKARGITAANWQASLAESESQNHIVVVTKRILQEVPAYVTPAQDAVGCITFGFVRVLNAAANGVDPASLSLPAGESDDTCTGLAVSAVAATLADAYGTSRQNSEQLDSLIASIRHNDAISTGSAVSPAP
jgi:hypothetical protein